MSKRSQVSLEAKLRAVKQCIAFKSSPNQEAKQLGCSAYTVRKWIWKYKEEGLHGLVESRTWSVLQRTKTSCGPRCIVRAFLHRKGHPNLSYFKPKRFIELDFQVYSRDRMEKHPSK